MPGCFSIRSCPPRPDLEKPISQFCSWPVVARFFSTQGTTCLVMNVSYWIFEFLGLSAYQGSIPKVASMIVRLYLFCASSLRSVSSPSLNSLPRPAWTGQHKQEIVRHPRRRMRGRQNPHHRGSRPVVGGNDLVRPDAVGVGTHVVNLETSKAGGISTRPVTGGAGTVNHDARGAPGQAAVRGSQTLDTVLQERRSSSRQL